MRYEMICLVILLAVVVASAQVVTIKCPSQTNLAQFTLSVSNTSVTYKACIPEGTGFLLVCNRFQYSSRGVNLTKTINVGRSSAVAKDISDCIIFSYYSKEIIVLASKTTTVSP